MICYTPVAVLFSVFGSIVDLSLYVSRAHVIQRAARLVDTLIVGVGINFY